MYLLLQGNESNFKLFRDLVYDLRFAKKSSGHGVNGVQPPGPSDCDILANQTAFWSKFQPQVWAERL